MIKRDLLDVGALVIRHEIEEAAMSKFEEAQKKQVCMLDKATEKSNKETKEVLIVLV